MKIQVDTIMLDSNLRRTIKIMRRRKENGMKEILKEAAEILEDIADVSNRAGKANEGRSGTAYINEKQASHMKEIASSIYALLERMDTVKAGQEIIVIKPTE